MEQQGGRIWVESMVKGAYSRLCSRPGMMEEEKTYFICGFKLPKLFISPEISVQII